MNNPSKYENKLACSVLVRLTPSLFNNIAAQADGYNMLRATFIRQLLEAIDDEQLYSKLMGPK